MPLTKIEAEIEIPEGFEFDRVDTKTKDGDYDFDGAAWYEHGKMFNSPRILLRKKKPKTRWFRAMRKRDKYGRIYTDSYSGVSDEHKISIDMSYPEITPGFLNWITDWIEYPIE